MPLTSGGTTDLTRYPARAGNDDLVMMASAPATPEQPFAWSAAVMDGYLWFSLKNPAYFPCTLFWMSNGGRTAPPWNSRHFGRLGIEDVCSYFANGVDLSRQHPLSGIPTVRRFRSDVTVSLKVVQGVAVVPQDFGLTTSIRPVAENSVAITGESGKEIIIPMEWEFVL